MLGQGKSIGIALLWKIKWSSSKLINMRVYKEGQEGKQDLWCKHSSQVRDEARQTPTEMQKLFS